MKKRYIVLILIVVVIGILDQWSKQMVLDHFSLHENLDLIDGFFGLTYVQNPAAAFGFLGGIPEALRKMFFMLIPPLAMIFIFAMIRALNESQRYQQIALSLIFAGALGNYIDRLRFGFVVDFLDAHYHRIYTWPAFNVADSSIVIGVTLLILQMIFEKSKVPEKVSG